jgi:hypothetical protein
MGPVGTAAIVTELVPKAPSLQRWAGAAFSSDAATWWFSR